MSMSPFIQKVFSSLAVLMATVLISPLESQGRESVSWEGKTIFVRDSRRSSSRTYKRQQREQKKLERKWEREQIREERRQARARYSRGSDYYPYYRSRKNPVVSRDEYWEERYTPDGTYHSEEVTEDRHQSYYSPGRQEAITPPHTTEDTWTYGDGTIKSREKTSWIGRDGQYHSTTINRTANVDDEGNTHTQTHVDLKRQASSSTPRNASTASPTTEIHPSPPQKETPSNSLPAQPSAQASSQASPEASASSSSSSSSSSKPEPTPKPTEVENEVPASPQNVSQ